MLDKHYCGNQQFGFIILWYESFTFLIFVIILRIEYRVGSPC